jgi:hypothetical protein
VTGGIAGLRRVDGDAGRGRDQRAQPGSRHRAGQGRAWHGQDQRNGYCGGEERAYQRDHEETTARARGRPRRITWNQPGA